MLRDRARNSNKLSVWRIAVYKKDNFICQHCGSKANLHAHHIKEWATHPDLRFEIKNGLTLCGACHGAVHGKNFTKRKSKICANCSKTIANKTGTGLCHSCAAKKHWLYRWEKFTGKEAVREDGVEWSELNG